MNVRGKTQTVIIIIIIKSNAKVIAYTYIHLFMDACIHFGLRRAHVNESIMLNHRTHANGLILFFVYPRSNGHGSK